MVVGSAMLPAGFAAGVLLCLSLAALTWVFYTDIKSRRDFRESHAVPDDLAADGD